jgi:nitroimidazol reductase NimA-like FMN-containing flavoprotein (pyridoxamine 5'-phosphate oxidase superfamily)
MIGHLTDIQIDQVLQRQLVGRIACAFENIPYIVPVTYTFDGKSIYGHSQLGKKIEWMRKNPRVCFEVEETDNLANWRTVIIEGTFEELASTEEKNYALHLLKEKFAPLPTGEAAKELHSGPKPPLVVEKKARAILFKINPTEKTGRFEKQ